MADGNVDVGTSRSSASDLTLDALWEVDARALRNFGSDRGSQGQRGGQNNAGSGRHFEIDDE